MKRVERSLRSGLIGIGLVLVHTAVAQIANTGFADSTGGVRLGNAQLALGASIDVYRTFSRTDREEITGLVSSSRLNEWNVNLALLDVRFRLDRVRGRLIPGFGTYMERNYAPGEPRLLEGNVGFRPFPRSDLWIDIGILGSPFTNETPIARDHLMYTRSLSAEYVPYFLSGARASLPFGKRITAYAYWVNGWQQVRDQVKGSAGLVQIEYRPHSTWLLNLNAFTGREQHATAGSTAPRHFLDFYCIHDNARGTRLTGSAYAGLQSGDAWQQANLIVERTLRSRLSASLRAEWFRDPAGVVLPTALTAPDRGLFGYALGLRLPIEDHVLVRAEYRALEGTWTPDGRSPHHYFTLHAGLTL
jgi:hypothetical protein